jgi:hypothetical protein
MGQLLHSLLHFPFLTAGAVISFCLIAGLAFSTLGDRQRERKIAELVKRARSHSGHGAPQEQPAHPAAGAGPGSAGRTLPSALARLVSWKLMLLLVLGAALVLALVSQSKSSLPVQARTPALAPRGIERSEKTNLLAQTHPIDLSDRSASSPWTAETSLRTPRPAPRAASRSVASASSIVLTDPAKPLADTTLPPNLDWGILETIHPREVTAPVPARLAQQPLFVKGRLP